MAPARWYTSTALLALPYIVFVIVLVGSQVTDRVALVGAMYAGTQVTGLITTVTAARRSAVAWPWWLLAGGFVVLMATGIAFVNSGTAEGTGSVTGGHQGWLMTAVVLRVVFALMLLGALFGLSKPSTAPGARWRLGLDAATVLGGGMMALWYFVLGPVVDRWGTFDPATYAYTFMPLADLGLVIGVSTALLRGSAPAGRRPLLLLLAGAVCYCVADVTFAVLAVNPEIQVLPSTRNLLQLVPQVLLVAAATEQCRAVVTQREASGAPALRPVTWLPYIALVGGFGLLAFAARDTLYPWLGLVVGAIVMTTSVASRQYLVLRENRTLATSDALTGLANRNRLREILHDAEVRQHRTGRDFAFMVIDLDDFKPVNDTMGHEAGDILLMRFADVLRAALPASGTAARLGGDEFAVVLPDVLTTGEATRVADTILREIDIPFDVLGNPVRVRASIGIAVAVAGTPDGELPHRADLAMYEAKRSGTGGWRLYADDDSGASRDVIRNAGNPSRLPGPRKGEHTTGTSTRHVDSSTDT